MACHESTVGFLRSLGYATLLLPREHTRPSTWWGIRPEDAPASSVR